MLERKNQGLKLDTPLQYVKGAGPIIADFLKKRELHSVQDLMERLPRSWQDNRVVSSLEGLSPGQNVTIRADVVKKRILPLKNFKKIYMITVSDGKVELDCKFFRLPFKNWFNSIRVGDRVEAVGKLSSYKGKMELHHPQLYPASEEEVDTKELVVPVYPEIENVSSLKMKKLIHQVFQDLKLSEEEVEYLPKTLRDKYNLITRLEALKGVHLPDETHMEEYLNFKTKFQKRLIFDEFFELQFYFALKRQGFRLKNAPPISVDENFVKEAIKKLPFSLTGAQERALDVIFQDLNSSSPMHRLIQGDVGSGKTVLALIAALVSAKKGFQTAIMAPTEILALQHFKNASKFLEPFDVKVELLTGKMKAKDKRVVGSALKLGLCQVVIGTHALISEDVEFQNLGFVVVDEQHRFGASQRARLKTKARQPHFLVMTATPIPRSLSLALYGDLDFL